MIDREEAEHFRPVMMWFWNDKMDEAEIVRQIDEFSNQRIRQFFIHPAIAFEEEYLSDRFFELIRIAADHAKSRGMKFWIYDEYNWPSGAVGGKLLQQYPEYRMLAVRYAKEAFNQGQPVRMRFEGNLLSAFAVFGDKTRDITGEGSVDIRNRTFHWNNPDTSPCDVYVFYEEVQGGLFAFSLSSKHSTFQEGYLDTMNPEAVRKFLEMAYESYEKHVGQHFGDTIPGIFTDEVNLANPFDFGPETIPWTKDFLRIFREENGYDLAPKLVELAVDAGTFRRTRYDFWKTLTERFATAFAKQAAQWCEERGLLLTGHCSGEENLVADVLQSGNAFLFLRHFHVPGIDSIFSKERIHWEDFNLAGKMISSLAEHSGAPRTLCETYTGSGWDLTMEDMKKIFNRLAVLGVNTIQFMGAYYSMRGSRKRLPMLYQPTHFEQVPIWRHYGELSDYMALLCRTNSIGQHGADIAILMPTTSVWTEYALRHPFWNCMKPDHERGYGDVTITERSMHALVNGLLQIQRDYDVLHELSLEEAEIEGGVVRFRGHAYRTLIVPSAVTLTEAIWTSLKRYANTGGRIVFLNFLPGYTPHSELSAEIAELTGLSVSSIADETRTRFWEKSPYTKLHRQENIIHILSNELTNNNNAGLRQALQEAFVDHTPLLELEGSCPHVHLHHRKDGSRDVFLFINDDLRLDYQGALRIRREGQITLTDPATGRTILAQAERTDAYLTVPFTLAGGAACIVEIGQDEVGEAVQQPSEPAKVMKLDRDWHFAPENDLNLMRLPVECALGHSLENDRWFEIKDFMFPALEGFELGAPYVTRMRFVVDEIPSVIELITDPEDEATILVNGNQVDPEIGEPLWDRTNRIYSIRSLLKCGDNEILVRGRIPDWGATHMPLFAVLRGTFALSGNRSLVSPPSKLATGQSWTEQGYPDFSGTGVYRISFELPQDANIEKVALRISECPDVTEVWCNGQNAGSRLWNPHAYDLSGLLTQGSNELEVRVVSTLCNLMERSVPSGITGEVLLQFD